VLPADGVNKNEIVLRGLFRFLKATKTDDEQRTFDLIDKFCPVVGGKSIVVRGHIVNNFMLIAFWKAKAYAF
jgi:hypothetical protein